MPMILISLLGYLKSLFGFFIKHPEILVAVIVACVLTFFYIENHHLHSTINKNKTQIAELSAAVDGYKTEVNKIVELDAQRTAAQKKQEELYSEQSRKLTELSSRLNTTNLDVIKTSKGLAGLQAFINVQYVDILSCIENTTQSPPIPCRIPTVAGEPQ